MDEISKKILIIEDDKDFLWILEQSLSSNGFSIIHALNAEDGLVLAEKEKPDLIVIDIKLPKMDGITMAKKIKEKGIKSQIMFLTSFSDAEHISQAIESVSETDYIVKSDTPVDNIVSRIKEKLGIK